MSSDDVGVVLTSAIAGFGIGIAPALYAARHIEEGRLRRVLEGWRVGGAALYLVYPAARFLPAKTRAFRDALVEWASAFSFDCVGEQ